MTSITCALYIFSILNNLNTKNSVPLNHSCVQEIDFEVTASANAVDHRVRDCKVVIEDIATKDVAAKLHTLNPTPGKLHKRDSRVTEEVKYLQLLQAKTPIAWGKMNDDRWSTLDNAVGSKLQKCRSLSDRVDLLQDSIYQEASKIFDLASLKW